MKLKRNKIHLSLLAGLVASVPIITSVSIVLSNVTNTAVVNQEDAFKYVLDNSTKKIQKEKNDNSKWSITLSNSNEIIYFDSPEQMRAELSKYTEETFANTSYNLENYIDPATGILGGDQQGDDLWKHLNLGIKDSDLQIKTVYRGENGQIFTDLDLAKNSYLQLHEAYYFNDIYFNTKEELRKYLLDEYFYGTTMKTNAITIKAPNKTISAPINLNDKNFNRIVETFVTSNAAKVIKYDRTKNEDGEIVDDKSLYFTTENFMANSNELNLQDLDYQYIASNQGKSKYILDLDMDDKNELYAPYVFEGTLDVGSFSDKNNWQKVKNSDNLYVGYREGKINDAIGKFFSFLLAEDQTIINFASQQNISNKKIFNIPSIKVDSNYDLQLLEQISFDQYYMEQLKLHSNILFNDVINMYSTLIRGKRYNAFYKIPIMYSYIMQRLVSYNMPQKLLNMTCDYFEAICAYLQDCLETVMLDQQLLSNFRKPSVKFNLAKFFHIGDPQFDISTSIEAYMEILKSDYPLLVGGILAAITGINDLNAYAGLINNYYQVMRSLERYKIINQHNVDLFNQKDSSINNVYKLFSKQNLETFKNFIIQENSELQAPKHSQFFKVNDYINTISFELHYYILNANNYVAKDNFKVMSNFNSGFNYFIDKDYLSKILDNDASIIKELIFNTSYTPYQVYLLLFASLTNFYYDYNQYDATWQGLNAKLTNFLHAIVSISEHVVYQIFSNVASKINKIFSDDIHSFSLPAVNKYRANSDINLLEIMDFFVDIVSTGMQLFKETVPFVGTVINLVWSIASVFIPEVKNFYYVYTTSTNEQFVWDGGFESTGFFGLIKYDSKTNENMKLLDPIQIVLPQMQDCYYYDRVRYSSPEEIKRVQLQHMMTNLISGKPLNSRKRFSYIYTFDKIPFYNNLPADDYSELDKFDGYTSIDMLSTAVLASIKNSETKYIQSEIMAFKDGFNASTDIDAISHLTDNVISNIRPTWIALKPIYDELTGYPIKQNANRKFIYPNKSWSSAAGLFINDQINYDKYFIDNSANNLKAKTDLENDGIINKNDYVISSQFQAADIAQQNLTTNFMKQLQIESKTVLTSEFISNNNFDDLNDTVYKQKIYKVTLPNNEFQYFIDVVSAQCWLNQNLKVKKIGSYITNNLYEFNDYTFKSIAEMRSWTYANLDLINQMRGK